MYSFTSLVDSSARSNDNKNPTGTHDKELLGEDISKGRSGEIDVVTPQVIVKFPQAPLTTSIQTTICKSFAEVDFISAIVSYTSPLEYQRHHYTNGDIKRMDRIHGG